MLNDRHSSSHLPFSSSKPVLRIWFPIMTILNNLTTLPNPWEFGKSIDLL